MNQNFISYKNLALICTVNLRKKTVQSSYKIFIRVFTLIPKKILPMKLNMGEILNLKHSFTYLFYIIYNLKKYNNSIIYLYGQTARHNPLKQSHSKSKNT